MNSYLYPRHSINKVGPLVNSRGSSPGNELFYINGPSQTRTSERLPQNGPAYEADRTGLTGWQAQKRVLFIGLAACLFCLSMSGFALGILGVSQHLLLGICSLSGGILLQVMAIYTALLAGRK